MQESELGLRERYLVALARQDIEQLRRLYCVATDALGRVESEADRVFGIETYHRIFTPDVIVNVTGTPTPLTGKGPDAWVDVVTHALGQYESTQHLVGTQLVYFDDVETAGDNFVAGTATMTSYLHAWHVWPNRKLRLVMGTYTDKVRFSPDAGWQIAAMTLQHTSAEHRMLGDMT